MKYLETVFQKEIAIIVSALLLSVGAYTAATYHTESKPITDVQLRTYDIDTMMQTISVDSSQQDLSNANFKVMMQVLWANRQTQTQDVVKFSTYLNACNQVVLSYLHHTQPDLTAMNTAKAALY
jgi:hypothetical protein